MFRPNEAAEHCTVKRFMICNFAKHYGDSKVTGNRNAMRMLQIFESSACRALIEIPEEKRLLGKPKSSWENINPLYAELNPICYLLALLGAHHFLHVSRIRVKSLTLRSLMSYIYIYIYGAPILDVSRSHTTTHHSR